jgi:uncharacterized protein (TIGR00299 family) protein
MRIAYFDCFSGISGNMILGGFLDLGVPLHVMEEHLGKLGLESFDIEASPADRAHLAGTHVTVRPRESATPERDFRDIRTLIEESALHEDIKRSSVLAFRRLAEAEGRIHREEPEHVHFHEVGALDSIVDIVGGFIGIHHLEVDRVYASRIPLGRGMIECRHGRIPVPAPATVDLLKGVPVYDSEVEAELVTPTGAAWITTLTDQFGTMPDMQIERVGYGIGDRDLGSIPNMLRILLGRAKPAFIQDRVMVVETDIDDMNPELFEPLMEGLFATGALDVSLVPIQRKKNRPGVTVRTICEESRRGDVVETILRESTSIGVRYFPVQREKLDRRIEQVDTPFGRVKVKISESKQGRIHHVSPEYEDCRRIGIKARVPVMRVYEEALLAARKAKSAS